MVIRDPSFVPWYRRVARIAVAGGAHGPKAAGVRLRFRFGCFTGPGGCRAGRGRGIHELHHDVAPLPFSPPTRSSQHPPQPTPTPYPSAPTPFPTKEPTNQPTNQHQHRHPPPHLVPHPPQLQRPSKRAASDSGGKAATAGENRSRFCCVWRSGGRAWCVDQKLPTPPPTPQPAPSPLHPPPSLPKSPPTSPPTSTSTGTHLRT